MEIFGKRAVVTGAAVGTGRAIASRLAAEGAEVVLVDIDDEAGHRAAEAINAASGSTTAASLGSGAPRFRPVARYEHVDLLDDQALTRLLDETRPDILVNNAGGGAVLRPCFPDADAARWSASLDLNLRAPMLATQLVLEPMREAGGGAVVNLGSTAGRGLGPHVSPEYSASKAGLIRFTATLAPLRESHQVRVNCVVPDWVATERGIAEREDLPAEERGPEQIPLQTLTDAVVRLIKDDSLAGRVILLERERSPELLDL
ncbi:SDR family NAD(P)-dependent oxidoreductase [Kribbella lupini]|uniref:3-oxoacyl-[acyl-carrier protein] reductase n=1 Tax=Kribbella lupini TaxID=291602 RepID=A0ABP4L6S2_9ACTN